jgi:Flp pilus assembly pilin Flp
MVRGASCRVVIMRQFFNHFLLEERAATAVEYAVMLALIMGTIFASVVAFGTATSGTWNNIQISIHNAGVGS